MTGAGGGLGRCHALELARRGARVVVNDLGSTVDGSGASTSAAQAVVDEIIAANPDKVEQAKAKPTLAGWFVGQVMKATQGKANPQAVQALVKQKLGLEE